MFDADLIAKFAKKARQGSVRIGLRIFEAVYILDDAEEFRRRQAGSR